MPIRSLTFSPDSQLLTSASDDASIKIYDVQHANLIGTVPLDTSCVKIYDVQHANLIGTEPLDTSCVRYNQDPSQTLTSKAGAPIEIVPDFVYLGLYF